MTVRLSSQAFAKAVPACKEVSAWIPLAEEFFEKYQINTNARIAGFLAQVGHESGDLNRTVENLNYSATRLRQIFPRYFPSVALANQYANKPEAIANRVYDDANRVNKIGNTKPGDGWLFRGSGLIQMTGRTNISVFAKEVGMTPEAAAEYARTKRGAMHSACLFWAKNNINRFCDAGDITGMSRAINGGDIGMADRKKRWAVTKTLNFMNPVAGEYGPLSVGSRGELVRSCQVSLGLTGRDADGIYGKKTAAAVSEWQRSHKYSVTGSLTGEQVKKLIEG